MADAINQDGTPNSVEHPAVSGTVVTVYVTGLGALTPSAVDGAPGDGIAVPRIGPVYVQGDYLDSTVTPVTVSGRTNAVVAVQFAVPVVSASSGTMPIRLSFSSPDPYSTNPWFSADPYGIAPLPFSFIYIRP